MDFYNYINSEDIKEYLMSLKYRFNPIEASWLVYQSGKHTLEDKIDAWNWIIENMPDCEVKERMNCSYRESLHETLKAYINLMKKYTTEFYENDGCVYTYGYYHINYDEWQDDRGIYKSVDDCFEDLFFRCDEEEKSNYIEICVARRSLLSDKRTIEAYFNKYKEILSINVYGETDDESGLTCEFFDGLWFAFPTPFKKGDAVIRYNEKEFPEDRLEGGILILTGCTPEWFKGEDPKRIQSYLDGRNGDTTDMNVWGYFQAEDGRIYSETTHNYMDFEFYRGPYEGKRRLMKALSSFLQDKIDLSMLLTAYRKVILDEFTKDVMLTNWYTDEGLELAGLSDEVELKNRQKTKANLNRQVDIYKLEKREGNSEAIGLAKSIASNYGPSEGPVYIYGKTCTGKTTLLQALGNLRINLSKRNVLYVTSEEFVNDVFGARSGENSKLLKLRDKYRKVDTLLFDDIQFIVGKEVASEEFFHIFEALNNFGKQVVVTADRPLEELDISDRLKAHLMRGKIVEMK